MIKIMLIDDHQVITDGLAMLLPTLIGCEISCIAHSANDAIDKASKTDLDIILMDLVLPGPLNGIDLTIKILKDKPKIKIICLSMVGDATSISGMLKAGASGYVIKNASGTDLKNAILTVLKDEYYIHPALMKFFINAHKHGKISRQMLLSDVEFQILTEVAKGKTTKEIAVGLFRSEETIRSRRKLLLKKFSCNNSTELIAYAMRNKFIS